MPKVSFPLRQWVRKNKRNMVIFGAVGFGVPMWLMEIWITWDFLHTFSWILFVGAASLGVGLLWGWGIWHAIQFVQRKKRTILNR